MTDNPDRISELIQRLETLSRQQEIFSKEIYALRSELYQLRAEAAPAQAPGSATGASGFTVMPEKPAPQPGQSVPSAKPVAPVRPVPPPAVPRPPATKTNLEKFIGENLINKIGIAITVIGVGIGAKYSIEHDLISPLTRIVLGYLVGLGLLLVGIKLKQQYTAFSAVLVSGAMAIMYFITYAAYSFYNLFPQTMAFVLMLVFTVFTVVAALQYNMQVIAHIGLVGAYAVPFLLSDGSGKVAILFSYMAIINTGILVLAFKKYWKSLYYAAFCLSWLIYAGWYFARYDAATHFTLALVFATIFFLLFYSIFLAYKLVKKENYGLTDILLLLSNAFIFYGLGYSLLSGNAGGSELLGLFTLANALVHSAVSAVIYRQKLADRNLFFLVAGLSLVFITIAVPVQLNGSWVTLLWVGEALLLFWIGRTKQVGVYEWLSYPLMALAFASLVQDWVTLAYQDLYLRETPAVYSKPLLNIRFTGCLLFIAAFAGIYRINAQNRDKPALEKTLLSIVSFAIPAVLLFVMYYSLRMEIVDYWDHLYNESLLPAKMKGSGYTGPAGNDDILKFKTVWLLHYAMAFMLLLSLINIKKIRNRQLGFINLSLNIITIAVFLLQGLYALSELRDSYLGKNGADYHQTGWLHIEIRYISLALLALLLLVCYRYIKVDFMRVNFKMGFDLLLHLSILWAASSELINWLELGNSSQSYKLGLSILWGVYALLLIALGIWKNKKHLRVGAIVLFGITLVKLFFYDIADLDTIAKTIVFVSLGVLLLIISFMYNKYKHLITDETGV
jgi:uncharacterized membrane protein